MQSKKTLIVGGGLAGICVAIHLLDQNQQVTLVHNDINVSSAVAAGQINPIVFRRMTKSWRVDDFVDYGYAFYRKLEEKTKTNFFHPIPIRRLFSSEQERDLWLKKQTDEGFKAYLTPVTSEDANYTLSKNDFGSGVVKLASYVDTETFLATSLSYIEEAEQGKIIHEKFDYQKFNPSSAHYQNEQYDEVIFCEGYLNYENPWFNQLPVQQTKGEVLTITSNIIPTNESLNRKCFILPIGNQTFRMGATYVWKTKDLTVTEEGRNELVEKGAYLFDSSAYTIIEQKAGIRPTTLDRRPIIGRHPEFPKLSIFNGLGTKGYQIAPKMAAEFVDFLLHNTPLDKEVKLERFL